MIQRTHFAFVAGLLLFSGCGREKTTHLQIEKTPQQTLRGWGIFPCTFQTDRPNPELYTLFDRPVAQKLIYRDLGATFIRASLLPGFYDSKRDDGSLDTAYFDKTLVRHLAIARRFGHQKFILTVWSPPAIFKNPATSFGTDPKTKKLAFLRADREDDYCLFVVKSLDYLKAKGFPAPLAYSVQNEPNYAAEQWMGTPYSPAQWRRVTVKLRRALDEGGYKNVQMIGPEAGSYVGAVEFMGGPRAPVFGSEPEFAKALDGFAFHGYTIDSKKSPHPENLRAVALEAKKRDKSVWMSEWSIIAQNPTPMQHCLETARRLGREVAYIPCDYWAWWQGWYWRHPKGEVLITGKDDAKLHVSRTYYFLQKLWQLAPAGSRVFLVRSDDAQIRGFAPDAVETVAFEKDGRGVVMIVNPTAFKKTIELRGLKGKTATLWITDARRDMAKNGVYAMKKGAAQFTVPPQSVNLVAG